jgi:hypothetical protein
MAKRYSELNEELSAFIRQQKLYFVATASDSRINVSPKGLDSLRILDANTVAWLNVTGSGNESAAHVLEDGRMTMMFCAFEGKPLILRLYGKAKVYHAYDNEWSDLSANFELLPGTRQIFVLDIELVQTSCGFGVPHFEYQGERDLLLDWATNRGPEGLKEYWGRKNQESLDGKPTRIFAEDELPRDSTQE